MKFCWTTLRVNNMEESLDFYQRIVQLPLQRRSDVEGGMSLAFLGSGDTQVELIYRQGEKPAVYGKDISMGFQVDDLDAMMEFVTSQGIAIVGGPFKPNEHVRFFYVLDPNGLRIQFVEQIR
ncbi:VOC family protein [Sphaerochaeta sp. PS]|uniref:VOC family protein n=1 Tax=Sphaerochaeta sp. PS TaxID=3076336 RepID=UPI0028A5734B|nr:VOC family protein [Sphaerochaeta sp. PS]MDT4763418.1 VOC family protein [Sphaerochaeta sp. PS]